MAVEKLILKSILYGMDKIPDKWFDMIPGGYYKAKDGHIKKIPSGGLVDKGRGETRKARREDFYEDGYRSDRGRRRRRSRSSYDGGDDDSDSNDEGHHRRETDRSGRSRRGRRSAQDDRYGYDDGYRSGPYDPEYEARKRRERSNHRPDRSYDQRRSNPVLSAPPVQAPPIGMPQARHATMSNTYVPYAHIYGGAGQQRPQQHFTPDLFIHGTSPPRSRVPEWTRMTPAVPAPRESFPQRASTVATGGAASANPHTRNDGGPRRTGPQYDAYGYHADPELHPSDRPPSRYYQSVQPDPDDPRMGYGYPQGTAHTRGTYPNPHKGLNGQMPSHSALPDWTTRDQHTTHGGHGKRVHGQYYY